MYRAFSELRFADCGLSYMIYIGIPSWYDSCHCMALEDVMVWYK